MTPLRKPVTRVTARPFQNYGPDRERLFVVTLLPGDLLRLRPHRCRRPGCEVEVELSAIYTWMLRNRANADWSKKALEKKAAKAAARQKRVEARATRKLEREIFQS